MKNLYADDQKKPFETVFSNPGALYRDTPFWAWNCKLDAEQIERQIKVFREMGMGGFHMHARTGLATPYLGPEFMERVKECVASAKEKNMLAWLYDEDRFPSGAAGGLVTKDPAFRARRLLLTRERRTVPPDTANDNSGTLLCCYSIKLDKNGALEHYGRIGENDEPESGAEKFYAYLMVDEPTSWFNDQTYLDTLNKAAVEKFIEITYDAYFKAVGDEFDKTVPAIFTDEPQFTRKTALKFAREKRDAFMPYTNDLPESYRETYGSDFFDTFPEIIWELPGGKYSQARYRYHEHIAERFAAAFADTAGAWCEKHNIRLSGHMLEEHTLETQTSVVGEAMRSYRSFQFPGIDILCDHYEYCTAKQAQSASRQYGRGGVLCELDGVTDWDYTFMGHKGQGDWQAALGITVRVPHLSWMSMRGEAKRDYPASIHYQSAWYPKYKRIADHFARVNAAMTRGKARVKVAVIHPVESFWLVFGPQDVTAGKRAEISDNFEAILHILLHGLVDFDFIAESLLPELCAGQSGKTLNVGEMEYETVIVPPSITIRASTLERLEAFRNAGGRVIFAGDVPTCCDAVESDRAKQLAKRSEQIAFSRNSLLEALAEERELYVIRKEDGYPHGNLIHQMRQDGSERYLFLTNVDRISKACPCYVRIRGEFQVELLDSFTGDITPIEGTVENGWTVLENTFFPHGHLLLRLTPATNSKGAVLDVPFGDDLVTEAITEMRLPGPVPITLSEPNVLMLDMAKWKLGGDSEWQPTEEILRIDQLVRDRLNIRQRGGGIVQPWVYGESREVAGVLELLYEIDSEVGVKGSQFAMEEPENAELFFDGEKVPFQDCGYYIDESLRTTKLPDFAAGKHELRLRISFLDSGNLERCFLLGDFGVQVSGDSARIIAPVRELAWGNAVTQGLPFYGGNITYHCTFTLKKAEELMLRMPSRLTSMPEELRDNDAAKEIPFCGYRGVLLSAELDGKEAGELAFAPFQCRLGKVEPGEHKLDLTLYGSRFNAHGTVHLSFRIHWLGPCRWTSKGDMFCYDYQLVPLGITLSPKLLKDGSR